MADALEVSVAGVPLRLLADRALHWPERARLVVADLHLGKGDVFRAAGIPVPSGGTAHDLERLATLLRDTRATALWVLGDFLHGPWPDPVASAWRAFREAHADVDMLVVRGNHDRALDAGAAGVREVARSIHDGPFEFRHAPPGTPGGAHVVCGHVHPVVRLRGAGRFPLFWMQPDALVLPAFSRFSGGFAVRGSDSAGSVVCNGEQLVRLPGTA
ncbi:ligase-associated DNA damage response endonuclease PdeM [Luteimonas vadosa]|uniref:Ligase-associated DNA damage response endonuclease PdeM n=1 Tax=Luteimonas vadosa TaxID=1165507 RepID=A0ABP9DUC3_9GAMM